MHDWSLAPILIALLFSGCDRLKHQLIEEDVNQKEVLVSDTGDEVQIPEGLWPLLENEETKVTAASVQFLPISVTLREKSEKTLKEPAFKVIFPQGGGTLSLPQFVSGTTGTIYVGLEVEAEPEAEIQAFFISNAKKRRIDGEVWGAGCKTFYDITKFYKSTLSKGKFEVNLTRARHVSVLGGTFVVTSRHKKQISVAQITFKDSHQSHLYCDEVTKVNSQNE